MLYGPSGIGTNPYALSTTNDEHSGVKTSSLVCTSEDTNVATVNKISNSQSDIHIQSVKGSNSDYHYVQNTTLIRCSLSVVDNAGNNNTVEAIQRVGNGWVDLAEASPYCGNVIYKFISGTKAITGWINTNRQSNVYDSPLTYFFADDKGIMVNGWQKINGKWYYLWDPCSSGSYVKSGYTYGNGEMLWNDTLVSGGEEFSFGPSGACTSGRGC